MASRKILTVALMTLILISSFPVMSRGQVTAFRETPRAGGMGRAFIAVAEGVDAVFHNPSGLARNTRFPKIFYSGIDEFSYDWTREGLSQKFQDRGGYFTTVEYSASLTGRMRQVTGLPPDNISDESWSYREYHLEISSAEPTSEQLLVGLSGYYTYQTSADWKFSRQHSFGGDLSLLFSPQKYVQLGLVTHNLLKTKSNTVYFDYFGRGIVTRDAPRDFSVGVCFRLGRGFLLAGDIHNVLERTIHTATFENEIELRRSYHLGLEIDLFQTIQVRSGVSTSYQIVDFYDETDDGDFSYTATSSFSVGLGARYRHMSMDTAFILDKRRDKMKNFEDVTIKRDPYHLMFSLVWAL
ncbi:MAG: hypothetical protein D6675_11710 [Gemmatimonadetes bacterium]|nr:MAG: hypothetical protein D6675_11710 [Gemmatimonadota bacterium]